MYTILFKARTEFWQSYKTHLVLGSSVFMMSEGVNCVLGSEGDFACLYKIKIQSMLGPVYKNNEYLCGGPSIGRN